MADAHIVADVNQTVETHALFDMGIADGAAVHGAVGPELDIVLDHHPAQLRHAQQPFQAGHEGKALITDGVVGAHYNPVSDHRMGDHAIGADAAIIADHHAAPDHRIVADPAVLADLRARADLTAGTNLGAFANAGGGMHRLGCAHAGLQFGGRIEDVSHLRESQARIGHHQQGHAMGQGGELLIGDHHTGLGHREGVGVFGIAEQRDVAGFGAFQRGHVAQLQIGRFALGDLRADPAGNFGQRERPGAFVKSVIGHGGRP